MKRAVPWRNDIGQRLGLSCFDIRLLLSPIVLLLLHRLGFLELLSLGKLGVLVLRSKISSRPSPPVTLLHISDDGCIAICYYLESPLCLNHWCVLSVIYRFLRSFVVRQRLGILSAVNMWQVPDAHLRLFYCRKWESCFGCGLGPRHVLFCVLFPWSNVVLGSYEIGSSSQSCVTHPCC
jgi:hypothetical protein